MPAKKKSTASKAKASTKKKTTAKKSVTKPRAKASSGKKMTTKKTTTNKPPAKKMTPAKTVPTKKTSANTTDEPKVRVNKKTPQLVRGMKDIIPKEERYWLAVRNKAQEIAQSYCYSYMETPVVEDVNLFQRSIGKGTDIIEKEMYVFEDRDGSKLALRPELTASAARAYIVNGFMSMPQPVKTWYVGAMFRHDRPQAGRYRQFYQFDCEVMGERDPAIDAELIVVAYNFFRDLGIETEVHVNSIGNVEERQRYIVELTGYLRSKRSYLSEESRARITKNPLRVLDSKDPQDMAVIEEAPQIIDWLSETSKSYFMSVLEYLDELEVPYVLTPTLVRGLDYYTDTVFEFFETATEEEGGTGLALGGGGRYDKLIEQLGSAEEVPACGFGLGLDRAVLVLKKQAERGALKLEASGPTVYFAQLGEQARRRAMALIETLRRDGIMVRHNLAKSALKAQLEIANKHSVTHTVILGQKEVQDGTVIIRDMDSGNQEIVDQRKLTNELRKIVK